MRTVSIMFVTGTFVRSVVRYWTQSRPITLFNFNIELGLLDAGFFLSAQDLLCKRSLLIFTHRVRSGHLYPLHVCIFHDSFVF